MRSGGRVVEGARLESVYTSKAYRGFESHPLRQAPPALVSPCRVAPQRGGTGRFAKAIPLVAGDLPGVSRSFRPDIWPRSLRGSPSVRFPCFAGENREKCKF